MRWVRDDDLPEIRPDSGEHVYMVVADHIEAQIQNGAIPVGGRLLGQRDLASTYGVSTTTAARAVRELIERGLVRILRGKGVYVISTTRADDSGSD